MPHHWQKMRAEEYLFSSGLAFTILQPTAYMQNLLSQWSNVLNEGVLRQPYAPETRVSLVDLQDVAQVAARTLLESGHEGAIYELVGTSALTQHEVADAFSLVLARSVRAEKLSRQQWLKRAAGLGEYARSTLLKMFEYYESYGLAGNSNVLHWLLGREPASLAAFIQRTTHTPG